MNPPISFQQGFNNQAVGEVGEGDRTESQGKGERKTHLQPSVQQKGDEKRKRKGNGREDGNSELIDLCHVPIFQIGKEDAEDRHQRKSNDKTGQDRPAAGQPRGESDQETGEKRFC